MDSAAVVLRLEARFVKSCVRHNRRRYLDVEGGPCCYSFRAFITLQNPTIASCI